MRLVRPIFVAAVAAALVLAACGDDQSTTVDQAGGTSTTSTPTPTTSTTAATGLGQPAIWPSSDVVFDTPEQAASDFVTKVFGVPPQLGDFQAGDSRSGEIEVLCCTEGGGTPSARGVLFLRQLGPDDGWFVIGAANDAETITSPESLAEVDAGPLTVTGSGRGFEGTVVVEAFVAGNPTAIDQVIAQGGSTEASESFSVTLDLSTAEAGDVVIVLVRGGVGLESDTGDFSAIGVVISGLSATG